MLMKEIGHALASDLDGAFPTVVEEMGSKIYWGLRRLSGNHQEAEDLTQETFIRAYQALSGYDRARIRGMSLQPWVWTIALNLCRNLARSRSRRPEVTGVDLDRSVANEDPATIASESADSAIWRRRLLRLKEPQRNAVVLHHVVGLPHHEIAEMTGRNESTTRSDLRRGLAALRGIIEEESS